MEITETKIKSIVERVVNRMADQKIADKPVANPKSSQSSRSSGNLGVYDDLDSAVSAAKQAFERYENIPLAMRNKIIESIRTTCREEIEHLSKMAVEETKFGRYEDKVRKNTLAINKTPGTEDLHTAAQSGDTGLTIWERAPYGVIGSITPCTNPTETIICNVIGMIAAGNAVVFCPHPAAKKTSVFTVNLLNEAILKDLPVICKEMTLDDAKEINATGVFEHKYGERVKVYFIGEGEQNISKEICGGPHVEHTGTMGKFKIIKEESSSAGVRRIKAILQ